MNIGRMTCRFLSVEPRLRYALGARNIVQIQFLLIALFVLIETVPHARAAEMIIDANDQLYLVGQIVQGDFERFKAALHKVPRRLHTINLRSPGGQLVEALQIGRLIRSLYLNTSAPASPESGPESRATHNCRGDPSSVRRPGTCTCGSACFFVWAGGVTRSGDQVYLHGMAFDKDNYRTLSPSEADARYEQIMRFVHDYLREMNVPEKYYQTLEATSYKSFVKVKYVEVKEDFPLVYPQQLNLWLNLRCERSKVVQDCWSVELGKLRESAIDVFRRKN